MNNQAVKVQTQIEDRAVYVKPNLENHLQYTAITTTGISTGGFIGQPIDLISDPGLELIPDPVDIGI
jgi:preprotein translocase subunit Sss1